MSPAATVLSGSSLESEAWAAPHVRAAVELPAGRNKSQPMQAALRPPDAATTSLRLRLRARRYPIPTQPCPPSSCRSCCSAPSYPALAVRSHWCPLRLSSLRCAPVSSRPLRHCPRPPRAATPQIRPPEAQSGPRPIAHRPSPATPRPQNQHFPRVHALASSADSLPIPPCSALFTRPHGSSRESTFLFLPQSPPGTSILPCAGLRILLPVLT